VRILVGEPGAGSVYHGRRSFSADASAAAAMYLRGLVLVFAVLLSMPGLRAANAQQDQTPKQGFVIALQKALRANDKAWLADHMSFPVRHNTERKALIRTKAAFIKHYSSIISARLRADVLAQSPDKLFSNWQGVMVGSGGRNIWIREFGEGPKRHYEIVTINDAE